jgi:hypothetical protein
MDKHSPELLFPLLAVAFCLPFVARGAAIVFAVCARPALLVFDAGGVASFFPKTGEVGTSPRSVMSFFSRRMAM